MIGGGTMAGAKPILNAVRHWARFQRATAIVSGGRPGWARAVGMPVDHESEDFTHFRLEL